MIAADLASYLPLILAGLAVLVFVIWLIARGGRKARVVEDDSAPGIARDVLAEGAAPAPRNQALIDAPRAVDLTPAQHSAAVPLGTDAEAAPEPEPAATGDDLTRIKGLGPRIAALLGELGISTFAQIAAWTPAEIARIDAKLGRFSGRITRDQWVEQARLLAAGDESAFAEQFGRIG
jgi:predicted flap endonuclease-1-like 5' DNA nuclease